MIHTVKGFGLVNKAEIDVFLELSCFFNDPADVGNLISMCLPYIAWHRGFFTITENSIGQCCSSSDDFSPMLWRVFGPWKGQYGKLSYGCQGGSKIEFSLWDSLRLEGKKMKGDYKVILFHQGLQGQLC